MFTWLFHRVSGLLLVVLLGMQMISGVLQLVKENSGVAEEARKLHMNGFCVTLMASLIIMHAMYGLRTVLYDVGVRKERLLFWVCTVCGVVLSVVYLWVYFRLA